MKIRYIKPIMYNINQTRAIVPLVAAVAAALGVSQAVAGLGMGIAAGYGAVSAVKKLGNDILILETLPALVTVE